MRRENGIFGPDNCEGFTGLARASICMEFPCKDKSFAEKSG